MSKRYSKNADAVFNLRYHIVFCPKYRRSVLDGEIKTRLKALLKEKANELGLTIHTMEVMPDHVHLFVEADPTFCVAEIVNLLKGVTSRVLRQEFATLRSRLPCMWSRSYYAGSAGCVSESVVRQYIEQQKGK